MTKCKVPPIGWNCTRDAGHSGPCAATETTSVEDMVNILNTLHIKPSEYTDCAIVYEVTFDSLRLLYNLGRLRGNS